MGKGSSAPQSPSPTATAAAQTGSNVSTALAQQQLNAINQTGPQGSITYDQTGTYQFTDPSNGQTYTLPKLTQTTTLSPQQQALYNAQQTSAQNLANIGVQQTGSLGSILNNRVTTDNLPAAGDLNALKAATPQLQTSLGNFDVSQVQQTLLDQLNKQSDRDKANLDTQLANSGIRVGSSPYDNAQDDFSQNLANNRVAAILNATAQQGQLINNAATQGNFANTAAQQNFTNQQSLYDAANAARANALNEQLTTRNQALNEDIGLATGTQIGMPNYSSTPSTGLAGTDVAGITQNAYNNQMAAYNQQQQQNNSLLGGLFGLGSSLIQFSDKRLKKNVKDTGLKLAGVPVKTWDWKSTGRQDVGVIAQEVERKHPELVDHSDPSGYRRVDYGGLIRLGMQEAA